HYPLWSSFETLVEALELTRVVLGEVHSLGHLGVAFFDSLAGIAHHVRDELGACTAQGVGDGEQELTALLRAGLGPLGSALDGAIDHAVDPIAIEQRVGVRDVTWAGRVEAFGATENPRAPLRTGEL